MVKDNSNNFCHKILMAHFTIDQKC